MSLQSCRVQNDLTQGFDPQRVHNEFIYQHVEVVQKVSVSQCHDDAGLVNAERFTQWSKVAEKVVLWSIYHRFFFAFILSALDRIVTILLFRLR